MRSFSPSRVVGILIAVTAGVAFGLWATSLHTPRAASRDLAVALRADVVPLQTDAPRSGLQDLAPLRRMIGDARIVGLGQSTHGTREFFRMRHRLVEFLVEEMGFRTIAIQASMRECEALNRYIRGGEGDPEKLLGDFLYWTWHTEEMLDLVGWMRSYNERHGPVLTLRGIDAIDDGLAVYELSQFFQLHDADFARAADSLAASVATASQSFGRDASLVDRRVLLQYVAATSAMRNRIESRVADLGRSVPSDELRAARINARLLSQYAVLYATTRFPESSQMHSAAMAENVEWLLGLEQDGTKMIVWSDNIEVDRAGWYFTTMGRRLADTYGSRYVALGLATGGGEYTGRDEYELGAYELAAPPKGSLERQLSMVGHERFLLDLRKARAEDSPILGSWLFRSIGAMTYGNGFYDAPVTDMFDALIYIERTTPTRVLGRPE